MESHPWTARGSSRDIALNGILKSLKSRFTMNGIFALYHNFIASNWQQFTFLNCIK